MARLAICFAATILAGSLALPALAQQPVISVPGVAPAAPPAPAGPIAPQIPDIYAPPAAAQMLNPTAPDASSAGAQVANLLNQVCIPLIRQGGDIKTIAKQVGLRMTRGNWIIQIDKQNSVQVLPPSLANPNVCRMIVNHTPGTRDALVNAIAYWGTSQNPPLKQLSNGYFTDAGTTRTYSWSWEADSPTEQVGLAYSEATVNGQPAGKGFDIGNLQYSVVKR